MDSTSWWYFVKYKQTDLIFYFDSLCLCSSFAVIVDSWIMIPPVAAAPSWRLISCFSAETSWVLLTDSCSPAAADSLFLLRLAPAADCTRPPSRTTRYELHSLQSSLFKHQYSWRWMMGRTCVRSHRNTLWGHEDVNVWFRQRAAS